MPDNLKLIRKQVARGLKAAGLTRPATLIKTAEGAYTPGAVSGDTAKTMTNYKARGIVADYTDDEIDGTLITKADRRIKLVGATIADGAVPEPGDAITIDGATYRIVRDGVKRDPASAIYTCQCRA